MLSSADAPTTSSHHAEQNGNATADADQPIRLYDSSDAQFGATSDLQQKQSSLSTMRHNVSAGGVRNPSFGATSGNRIKGSSVQGSRMHMVKVQRLQSKQQQQPVKAQGQLRLSQFELL